MYEALKATILNFNDKRKENDKINEYRRQERVSVVVDFLVTSTKESVASGYSLKLNRHTHDYRSIQPVPMIRTVTRTPKAAASL